MPSDPNTSASNVPASGSSGPTRRGRASSTVTSAAEAAEHLGQLDADGATAQHGQRGRHLLGLDGLAVGPVGRAGQSGHRGDPGPGPDVEDHGPFGLDDPVPHRHPLRPLQPSPSPHQAAALVLEPLGGHRVVPRRRWPRRGCVGPPGPSRAAPWPCRPCPAPGGLGQQIGGPDHHLGGDAPPVGALAPHQLGLHPDHVETGLGQTPGHVLATRPHPHHDHIGPFAHPGSSGLLRLSDRAGQRARPPADGPGRRSQRFYPATGRSAPPEGRSPGTRLPASPSAPAMTVGAYGTGPAWPAETRAWWWRATFRGRRSTRDIRAQRGRHLLAPAPRMRPGDHRHDGPP